MPSVRPTPLVIAVLFVLASVTAGCMDAGAPPDPSDEPGGDPFTRGGDDNSTSGSTGGSDPGDGSGSGPPTSGGDGNGTAGNGTGNETGTGTPGNATGNGTLPPHKWPSLSQATIRPGIMLFIDNAQGSDGYCTSNFVYRSPTNGTLYLGMAAHCTAGLGSVVHHSPDTTYLSGARGPRIGTVAYTSWNAMGWSPGTVDVGDDVHFHDFALVAIDDDKAGEVHPAVLHFGGPVALADYSGVRAFDRVIVYGNTPLRPGPEQLDWQEGLVKATDSGTKDGNAWYSIRTTVPGAIQGDSGSGLMTKDGKALGALSVISFGVPSGPENVYSSVPHALQYMRDNGWPIELQTWELLDDGLP